jgi:hypothetical protein
MQFIAYCAGAEMFALRPDCEDVCVLSVRQCSPKGMPKAWPLLFKQACHLPHNCFGGIVILYVDVRLPWVGLTSGPQPDPARLLGKFAQAARPCRQACLERATWKNRQGRPNIYTHKRPLAVSTGL